MVVLPILAVSTLIATVELRAQNSMPMLGSSMPSPDKSKGAQDPSDTQSKNNIALTTDPSPAQKGSDTFRVKVTGADGSAIAGAQVTITLSMPAMPEMGMAAMKTVVKATDSGGGLYEGKGDLASGGIWHVTITATKDKQTIATKRLTIKATGGM